MYYLKRIYFSFKLIKTKGVIKKSLASGVMTQLDSFPNRAGGMNANEFLFSVTDPVIADTHSKLIGKTEVVRLKE